MSRPEPGQLEGSLTDLAVRIPQRQEFRRRTLMDSRAGERTQQVHVSLSGMASQAWGYSDGQVAWEWPFLYAPSQRLAPFTTPHFGGQAAEIESSTGEFVHISAQVIGWLVTEEQWCLGANVRIACIAPLAVVPVPYSGVAHLTFQGYATYAEGDEFTP